MLTRRSSSDSLAKFGASLFNATVDLNPHQLDAALFAFRSPLSRGAILADEVGLGKTIEAGLIISQLWAEHKRRILVITPTTLRKQWAQELSDKFYIPSTVLDTREYNLKKRGGNEQPFQQQDTVVVCSYHFAASHQLEIANTPWHIVVIDEAHRLRNVYKPTNKIANALKLAVYSHPLLLLTATPLQNSLLELYGLVSFLDEHVFGSIEAFRNRYMRGPIAERELAELKQRLRPICQRTLRRQVQEYIRFTNRVSLAQDFTPTSAEQRLYDLVSDYLRRDNLHALPAGQRKLITMVMRKLLASSTFAVASTLRALAERLKKQLAREEPQQQALELLETDYETLPEEAEEWTDEANAVDDEISASIQEIKKEIAELTGYSDLAQQITSNAKGQALLQALDQGFQKMEALGAQRKAVIFTESRRTQTYLIDLLNANGYADRVITINGTNVDDRSGSIYRAWVERHKGEPVVTGNRSVDLRAAIVEHFRDHADILIATEAAAEGVNLQFCSLVVNYDLPWNPQRIEQRIGRCHRYGQKHDVVVFNFLNLGNEADQRVFDLLKEKFNLFDGVFGSSDEVLGALESGVDFERRIADIYQSCRTSEEIESAFSKLREELEVEITARMASTRTELLEHFDEDVRNRLRVTTEEREALLNGIERAFWNMTEFELQGAARFLGSDHRFELRPGLFPASEIPAGWYEFSRNPAAQTGPAHAYRPGHPLAERLAKRAKERSLPPARIVFRLSEHPGGHIGLLKEHLGRRGWLRLERLTVQTREDEDHILFAVMTDEGRPLPSDFGEKLFQVAGDRAQEIDVPEEVTLQLHNQMQALRAHTFEQVQDRNRLYFDQEMDKLDRWSGDRKYSLEIGIKELDNEIKQVGRDARSAVTLEEKIALQRRKRELEAQRSRKRRELFEAQDEVDLQKEKLLTDAETMLKQRTSQASLYTIQWEIV